MVFKYCIAYGKPSCCSCSIFKEGNNLSNKMEAGDCSTSGSNSAVNGSMTNEEEISHSLPTPDSADGKI